MWGSACHCACSPCEYIGLVLGIMNGLRTVSLFVALCSSTMPCPQGSAGVHGQHMQGRTFSFCFLDIPIPSSFFFF